MRIGLAKKVHGQYLLQQGSFISSFPNVTCSVFLERWHCHLGHPSLERIKHISCISIDESSSSPCMVCPKGKLIRVPFPSNVFNTYAIFEIIHVDVWGLYSTTDIYGNHYFLTIVDDYSKSNPVYLLKHKSRASQLV